MRREEIPREKFPADGILFYEKSSFPAGRMVFSIVSWEGPDDNQNPPRAIVQFYWTNCLLRYRHKEKGGKQNEASNWFFLHR